MISYSICLSPLDISLTIIISRSIPVTTTGIISFLKQISSYLNFISPCPLPTLTPQLPEGRDRQRQACHSELAHSNTGAPRDPSRLATRLVQECAGLSMPWGDVHRGSSVETLSHRWLHESQPGHQPCIMSLQCAALPDRARADSSGIPRRGLCPLPCLFRTPGSCQQRLAGGLLPDGFHLGKYLEVFFNLDFNKD